MTTSKFLALTNYHLDDFDIHDIGNEIQLAGGLWAGQGKIFIIPFPDETPQGRELVQLTMSLDDWQDFIRQTDLLEAEILKQGPDGITKAVVRKTQRQIDSRVQWKVFEHDEYTCRYCGKTGVPLTADHIITWESGGPTIPENLLTSCKKCNRTRGNTPYEDWIKSDEYKKISTPLTDKRKSDNVEIVKNLGKLEKLRVKNIRSR